MKSGGGKTLDISPDGSIQRLGFNAVELRKVVAEHDLLLPEQQNRPFSLQRDGVGLHRLLRGF